MRRRAAFFLVLALAVSLGLLVAHRITGGQAPDGEASIGVAVRRGMAADAAPGAEPVGAGVDAPEDRGPAPTPDVPGGGELERRDAAAARAGELDLARAAWIEGRVRIPPGAPNDPELMVFAFAVDEQMPYPFDPGWAGGWIGQLEHEGRPFARRPVEADGSFRVPHLPGARKVALLLDGRFLFMPGPLHVRVGGPDPELDSFLGGALLVRVRPPAGVGTDVCIGAELALRSSRGDAGFGFDMGSVPPRRYGLLGPELEVELGGLDVELTYSLELDANVLAPWRKGELRLEPGRMLVVEAELARGARVSGRVVDPAGVPVADAGVEAHPVDEVARWLYGTTRTTRTDGEGRFELAGIRPARKAVVSAEREGHGEGESDVLELADGTVLDGLEVVLDPGLSIGGVVLGPDGAPHAHAVVRARGAVSLQRGFRASGRSAPTDEQGRFRIVGLEAGLYDVIAAVEVGQWVAITESGRTAVTVAGPPLVLAPGIEQPERQLVAVARRVEAGRRDLELSLAEPPGISGRVVGPGGEPVTQFRVSAGETERGLGWQSFDASFEAQDGAFELAGPHPGTWKVEVEAIGHAPADGDGVEVEVPQAEPLLIRLELSARAGGVVLDPQGEPVPHASVSATRGPRGRAFRGGVGRSSSAQTDAEGRFELQDLQPGTMRLAASHGSWAPSDELVLELVAGAHAADLVLQLGRGGAIEGVIHDAAGRPDVGRSIYLLSVEGGGYSTTTGDSGAAISDSRGEFRMERVAPGTHQVIAEPRRERLAELLEQGEEPDPATFLQEMKSATVEVIEGETARVVLGAPPRAPVRVHGRVTRGGEPVRAGSVTAIAEGAGMIGSMKAASIARDGTFELVLDEPARAVLVVSSDSQMIGLGGGGVTFPVRVPEVESHRVDLDLPTASLSGVVLGPDGEPLAGQWVQLLPPAGGGGGFLDRMNASFSSAAGGFRFEGLRPGTYALQAGGFSFVGGALGAVVVEGLDVAEGAALEGVTVRLPEPARLAGVVVGPDGRPVDGATVYARDAGGRLLTGFQPAETGAGGRFELDGLAPGEVRVLARAGSLASAEHGPVRVRAGERAEVQLSLEEGTLLRVVLEDGEGAPVSASVSVVDEHGREQTGILSADALQSLLMKGFSTTEHEVGPLPPGRYTVLATRDGRAESRTVHLRSQGERRVVLRFRD